MLEGHGDDAYHYDNIRSDFSSNICAHDSHEALMSHLAAIPDILDHYPEPEAWSLERMIAEHHGIDPQCVIVTSGVTEAIYLIAQTFRYRPVIPQPTFNEYEDACRMYGDSDADSTILWLCNPNNPTGEVHDQFHIDSMIASHDLTVLDQSYEHYTSVPVMKSRLACSHNNIIQLHSMTKTYGVPGLRLGYITASVQLTERLRRNLRPWAVSSLAIEAGKYLLHNDALICRPDLVEAQRLRTSINQISGISVQPTQTNFMLCQLAHLTAAELKAHLARHHGILIRDASNFRGLTPYHFRIAAQSHAENDALIAALQHFLH